MPSPAPLLSSSHSSDSYPSSRSRSAPKRERRITVLRAVFAELVATTLFILVNCGIATHARLLNFAPGVASTAASIGAAFISIALIYSFSELSGGHFNPAVTFATFLRKKTSPMKSLLYITFQLIGSQIAMLALLASFGNTDSNLFSSLAVTDTERPLYAVFFLEFFSTFTLVFVIFCTAFEHLERENKRTMSFRGVSNSKGLTLYAANPQTKSGFAPIAIGLTIGALVGLGGCFNPARLISAAFWSGEFSGFLVYLSGQLAGAATAAAAEYGFLNFRLDFYVPGYIEGNAHESEADADEQDDTENPDAVQLAIPIEHRQD